MLATDILGYVQDLAALDSAVASFQSAYSSMSPATANTSLQQMDSALSAMQAAAQNESGSNLMMGNPNTCPDCLGVCPNTNFNYSAITAAQGEISDLDTKIASFSLLSTTVSAIEYSTQQRMAYQQGEAQSAIYAPQYQAAEAKYGYLKGQAVQTLLIVADPNYVSSASAFLNKSDAIEAEISTRNFTDFESLLSGYENAGTALSALNVNATVAYNGTLAAQDKADDAILEAQWQVNGLSKDSVNSYNSLVAAKANLDGLFDPPMTTAQYLALSAKYQNLTSSADAFIASSSSYEGTVFDASNAFSRTAVDGVMVIIKGLMPTSFETRQLVGEFVPPLMVAAIDLAILAIVMVVLLVLFYKVRGLFRSKLAIVGWVILMLGLIFVLLLGSVGFYAVVLSTERFSSYSDFQNLLAPSPTAAIVVNEAGATNGAITAMRACAGQIASQLNASGKQATIYDLGASGKCAVMPGAANTTAMPGNQTISQCLDSIPDIPIFNLQYSSSNLVPAFTTVVTEQALVSGNQAYYSKAPLCDIAKVLG